MYLSQDRSDTGFVEKELCNNMSKPRVSDMRAMKRFASYLIGRERYAIKFKWQRASSCIVWTDSDWAGGKVARKSTSGECCNGER